MCWGLSSPVTGKYSFVFDDKTCQYRFLFFGPVIMEFVPFVAENLFEPAVSQNGIEI